MIHPSAVFRLRTTRRARLGSVITTAALVVAAGASFVGGQRADAAATNGGAVQVLFPPGTATAGQAMSSGGSATAFALNPPSGAACTGDTATGGYRVQTYIVPAAVDPASLTFGTSPGGPLPAGTGPGLRQPLFSSGTPFVNKATAVNTGLLTGLAPFSFGVFGASGAAVVPPGTYNLGFACTLGAASATQLDKYWNVQLTVAADATDSPGGFTWTVVGGGTTTTTTTAASTTTSTTIAGGSTTTSTVVDGGTTTSTTTDAGSTTTTAFGSDSPTTTIYYGGGLAATGGSPVGPLTWALLLLVAGRVVILIGRRVRVLPPDAS